MSTPESKSDKRHNADASNHKFAPLGNKAEAFASINVDSDQQADSYDITKIRKQKDTENENKTANHTNRIIAFFTGGLLIVGGCQAWIINRQLETARLDERAWVSVKSIGVHLEIGKKVSADFVMTNTGKTPAQETWYYMVLITGPYEEFYSQALENEYSEPGGRNRIKATIFPDDEREIVIHAGTPAQLTGEQIEGIKAKKFHIYLFGNIHYRDVFGANHTTQLFAEYNPTEGTFTTKEEHNSAD